MIAEVGKVKHSPGASPMQLGKTVWKTLPGLVAAATVFAVSTQGVGGEPEKDPGRYEAAIRAFEEQDQKQPPPTEGILFIGSSSIRGWNLEPYFPDLPVINRGFGGSQISDSVAFAERIVLPYRPKVIVLYAGDNDVAAGKSPERVLADYKAFVAQVRRSLPKTRIVFIAIKPSIARWKLVDKIRQANGLIREVTEKDPGQVFVDVDPPMIGSDGTPKKELFKADGLHLNDTGYKLWAELVRPHLKLE
jgi:lysophospholipase L1-like esterase